MLRSFVTLRMTSHVKYLHVHVVTHTELSKVRENHPTTHLMQ